MAERTLRWRPRRGWQQFRRAWQRFRRWRRGRPFWGGLFLMLGGVQLFLSTQLDLMHVEVSFGPEGFLALVLPLVLLLCGILVWATPQHRFFYSIIGAVTAIYSLLGLNLGGWFLGMLFGILGGALGFAWTPVTAPEPRQPQPEPVQSPPDPPPAPDEPATEERRMRLALALPALLAASLAVPAAVAMPAAPATPQQCLIPIPLLCPQPPAPPDPTDPSPGPTPTPSPDPAPSPDPESDPEPEPDPEPDEEADGEIPRLESPTDLPLVAADPAVMTADRLRQETFRFEGITEIETTAGPVEVLQFSFSRSTATNFTLTTTTGGGDPAVITADPLVLAGEVTFYTSRFSGRLLGIPLELTPRAPVLLLLRLIRVPLDVTFTDVTLDLVFTSGAVLTADGFVLSA